jgi:hypothetical protein
MDISGPRGKLTYYGNGKVSITEEKDATYSKIVMVAGGTGITPMY